MIGASKILTVSYGTFSCTLEGFDDPFNTMRAIAEYFRDLAAEDRYFGAEPPTPDAAMLHKIAEREIQRRVEARVQDNGVILRAGDVKVMAAEPAMAPQDVVAEPAFALTQTASESVVARLARLRDAEAAAQAVGAVVVDPQPAAHVDQVAEQAEQAFELASQPDMQVHDDPEAANESEAPTEQSQDLTTETEEIAFAAEGASNDAFAADETDDTDANDIAAVMEAARPKSEPAPADAAPSSAPTVAKSDDDILLATLGAMIDPEGDDEFEDVISPDSPHAAVDADLVARFAADPEPADAAGPETSDEAEDVAAATGIAVAEDAFADTGSDSVTDPVGASAAEPQTDAAQERLQRARARVIKIRRINAADAIAPVVPAPFAPPAQPAEPAAPAADLSAPQSVLSPEAEAELQRELASLEADLSQPETAASLADPETATDPTEAAPDEPQEAAAAEPPRHAEPTPADDAVNRLISQTNAALEGPENKRRLAAIAHLKAAVAATFADRKSIAGPSQPGPTERMDPYRDDLDRVVRPRRPALVAPSGQENAAPSARPQIDTRPAPLVLVSEQRIDRATSGRPSVAPVTPVRPRRVTTALLTAADQTDTANVETDEDDEDGYLQAGGLENIFADPSQPFSDFADRLGASSMSELIEAAAAYCALMLGRDQFTRPLLLQQIADLPEGSQLTREDCLRGFGTLLRDGRIEKIKRGQFKLSEQSRYLAEGKRLAG